MKKTRAVYLAHMARMFALAGLPATAAAEAFRIETQLAKWQQDEVERRDPHKIYHRVERAGLDRDAKPFPWGDYLGALGIGAVTQITVTSPPYIAHVAKLIATEKPTALAAYLTWTVLRSAADELSKPWVDEAFAMQKELKGVKELPPRWRRCVNRVDGDLGELLGQSYVKARFGGDAKTRAVDLTKAVLGAMRVELDALVWMDDATRAAAKAKLDKMAYLVGFPDKWRTYDFEIRRTDYAGNLRAATHWEIARQLRKIGQPVDRFDWQMSPPTVNAYYDSSLNEIALPAGQLQAPFFGATFHPAVNFGSTGGGTIGHEMTHGFDDEGSQFDGDGNLKDWWSKGTKSKFGEATKCVQDQYSKYEAIPKVHLDGKLTSGENIADIGGVKLAFQAYQAWKAMQPQPVQAKIDDFTDDQLYFLAYGQSWCEKVTDAQLETMAHANPHSPPKWRVNGVIVNQPGFASAFKCAAGTPMNPGKACSVW
jgi:predicted metalloendopeptidase